MSPQLDLATAFGKAVRYWRIQRKLSQMELAYRAGLHLNGLGNLERGKRCPNLHTVFILAKALNVPPEKLVARVAAEAEV